ncbi:MAG: hypothetical protein QW478_00835 [Candidatus Micrarchaeaceae archaeon]
MPPKRVGQLNVALKRSATTTQKPLTPLNIPGMGPKPAQQIEELNVIKEQLPEIQPFVIDSLIPDIIYLYKEGGIDRLKQALSTANPMEPESLIFNDKSQDAHRHTQKIEFEILKNEPEVTEITNMTCRNPNCKGTKFIIFAPMQLRSSDEPQNFRVYCIQCRTSWIV